MSTLGEHQGNGIRFDMHLSAPNGGVAQMLCRPEGQWVSWNEYEKLKAEVERLESMADENAHLHKGIYSLSLNVVQLKAEVERLTKAEVERLRKEGEAMYPNLGPGWSHNAKEGKQP